MLDVIRHDYSGSLFHLWKGHREQMGGLPGTLAGRVHGRVNVLLNRILAALVKFYYVT